MHTWNRTPRQIANIIDQLAMFTMGFIAALVLHWIGYL
jgi:hypothetical protein